MKILPMCFFAYPSQPPDLDETIEHAIDEMNLAGTLQVYSWKHFSHPGSIILTEVCKGIDACNLFFCDLT
jgi:hypothetical protein